MGGGQTEQPLLGEEIVGPAMRIFSSTSKPQSSLQDTALTHADPSVQVCERRAVAAVLKVDEPAAKRRVHVNDNTQQRRAICPTGFQTEGVLEFLNALLSWPVSSHAKFVAQKSKALRPGIDDSCFPGMQDQTVVDRPLLHDLQSAWCVSRRLAEQQQR